MAKDSDKERMPNMRETPSGGVRPAGSITGAKEWKIQKILNNIGNKIAEVFKGRAQPPNQPAKWCNSPQSLTHEGHGQAAVSVTVS
jgi:hypothetical protein